MFASKLNEPEPIPARCISEFVELVICVWLVFTFIQVVESAYPPPTGEKHREISLAQTNMQYQG